MMNKDYKFKWFVLFPIIIYAIFLIFLPLLYIFLLSFFKSDSYGGILYTLTLENYLSIFNLVYIKVFLKSFLIAGISTIICILIAYPFSLFLSSKKEYTKNIIMTLVILPFLTNSLIRMYGWIVLLRKEGIINGLLEAFHIIDSPMPLMYNNFGIIVGMVYTLLPFMILPLYSSVEKMNKSLIEAAMDLGASKSQIFTQVILPQTASGLFNGSLMVFIPAIGYFFVSDILGGGKLMLIGNLIKNQFFTARNWPFGSAVAIVLILITFILIAIYKKLGGDMDELGGA